MSGDEAYWPWNILGLDGPTADKKVIRRAYAKNLKAIDPAKDPAGFQALREAYESALRETEYVEDVYESNDLDITPSDPPPADPISPEEHEAVRQVESPQPDLESTAPEPQEVFRRVEVPHTATQPSPAPEQSTEDIAALNALTDEVQTLLDLDNFDNARWAAVVRNPLLDVFTYANDIEHRIFGGLYTRIKYEENGEQRLPPFATPRWIELMDQRFGWTADLPLFRRKFGWQGAQILPLLSERLYHGKPNLPETYRPGQPTRRAWLQTAIMMCGGYYLLRLAILTVLP